MDAPQALVLFSVFKVIWMEVHAHKMSWEVRQMGQKEEPPYREKLEMSQQEYTRFSKDQVLQLE